MPMPLRDRAHSADHQIRATGHSLEAHQLIEAFDRYVQAAIEQSRTDA